MSKPQGYKSATMSKPQGYTAAAMSAPLYEPPLVELRGVSIKRGAAPLTGLDFAIYPAQHWLITGGNGSGKSTLLGLLRGDLSPASGTRRYFLDRAWRVAPLRARTQFALVSPDQEAFYLKRDTAQTAAQVLLSGLSGEMLRLWPATEAEQARMHEVAQSLNLSGLLERDMRTLSHGQRRRVLLGRALMPRPKMLLLDEFTDGLSPQARQELGEVLLRAAPECAVVLVTHRPEEAPPLAWKRAHIEGGRLRVLEDLPPVSRPVTSSPITAVPALALASPPPGEREKLLKPDDLPEILVELRCAEVYRNGHHALGPIDWQWRRAQHWLVTGENGAGKSTLARLVAGEFHAALGGSVTRPFLRRDLLSTRQQHIGIVGAELGIRAQREWTGQDILASAFGGTEGFTHAITPQQAQEVQRLAQVLELKPLLAAPATQMSQGQLRRLLLARAVLHRPTLLILDEGVDFLDAASREGFTALLPTLMQGGTHLMVISHRASDVLPGLTHHLHLEGGQATLPKQ